MAPLPPLGGVVSLSRSLRAQCAVQKWLGCPVPPAVLAVAILHLTSDEDLVPMVRSCLELIQCHLALGGDVCADVMDHITRMCCLHGTHMDIKTSCMQVLVTRPPQDLLFTCMKVLDSHFLPGIMLENGSLTRLSVLSLRFLALRLFHKPDLKLPKTSFLSAIGFLTDCMISPSCSGHITNEVFHVVLDILAAPLDEQNAEATDMAISTCGYFLRALASRPVPFSLCLSGPIVKFCADAIVKFSSKYFFGIMEIHRDCVTHFGLALAALLRQEDAHVVEFATDMLPKFQVCCNLATLKLRDSNVGSFLNHLFSGTFCDMFQLDPSGLMIAALRILQCSKEVKVFTVEAFASKLVVACLNSIVRVLGQPLFSRRSFVPTCVVLTNLVKRVHCFDLICSYQPTLLEFITKSVFADKISVDGTALTYALELLSAIMTSGEGALLHRFKKSIRDDPDCILALQASSGIHPACALFMAQWDIGMFAVPYSKSRAEITMRLLPECTGSWDCCVCLSANETDSRYSVLPCFHVLHTACLGMALEFVPLCPICKSDPLQQAASSMTHAP